MTIDRLQSKFGLFQISAENVMGTTGTASTIASNQFPGGYQFGGYNGFVAGSNSTNGGAQVAGYLPRGTSTADFQNFSTTGTITHDNVGLVMISVSTTGIILNIQQAAYDGQLLTIGCGGGTTGSIASLLTTTGIGGTTTAACQVAVATTFGSTGVVLQAQRLAQTATTNVPFVWRRVL